MLKYLSLISLLLFSTVAYSYVLGPVPTQPEINRYDTNVRPPLTDQGCDDCIKNYYSTGVQEDLIKYHEEMIWGSSERSKDESVE